METTEELKRQFAAQLLHNDGDPFKAAFAICGDNTGLALQIGRAWANDSFVLAEQKRLLGTNDAKSFLPAKEHQARDIYKLATDETKEPEDRLKAHRLYAEIMGHIEKPVAGAGINVLNQGVMIVKDAGTDDEWQKRVVAQQRALVSNATIN